MAKRAYATLRAAVVGGYPAGGCGAIPALVHKVVTCETWRNDCPTVPGPRGPHFSLALSGPLNPTRAVTSPAWKYTPRPGCYPRISLGQSPPAMTGESMVPTSIDRCDGVGHGNTHSPTARFCSTTHYRPRDHLHARLAQCAGCASSSFGAGNSRCVALCASRQ